MTYSPVAAPEVPEYGLNGDDVHSHTLPMRSLTPVALAPRGKLPTRAALWRPLDIEIGRAHV